MEPVLSPRTFSNRYELTHLIARGGMAQVYLAHDRLLDRPVAMKVLFPELSVDLAFVERFRREARAAANLTHPNIVQVFDWGEDEGTYYIVMEYIEGTSLSQMLREKTKLAPNEAATIAAKTAAALAYAHRRGMVHRDVKPGNILITANGEVHVTDFGIARAINTQDSLTQTGLVMGTAAYFSPEQAEGLTVDARSDLYSLGIVLYEMLTGRTPFVGDSPVAVASKHVREQAPLPTDFNSAIPAGLTAITMKAIAKAPVDRYQSAEDFRADLLRFNEGRPVLAETAVVPSPITGPVTTVIGATAAVSVGEPDTGTIRAITDTASIPVGGKAYEAAPVVASRKRSPWKIWLPILLALALIVAGIGIWSAAKSKNTVSIPEIAGQTQSAAQANLIGAGLVVGGTVGVSSTVQKGLAVGTKPKVGSNVARGTSVTLEYSIGVVPTETVPSVVGFTSSAAQATITAAGLIMKIQYAQSNLPADTVLSQDPIAGKSVPKGSTVVVQVPVAKSIQVPNVVGESPAQAGSAIGSAGLTLGVQNSACSNSIASGLVASTSPAVGSTVTAGTTVNLTISSGACMVTVQNVTGQNQGPATSTLQGQGFVVSVLAYSGPISCTGQTVVTQTPSGGSSALFGSTVTISICQTSATTTSTTSTTAPAG